MVARVDPIEGMDALAGSRGANARGRSRRSGIARLSVCLLAVSGLALAAASTALAEPIPPGDPRYLSSAPLYDENPVVTAEYTGKIVQVKNSAEGGNSDSLKAELTWKTKVTGPVDQIEYSSGFGPPIHWQLEELSGEVTDSRKEGSNSFSCTGKFSPMTEDGGLHGVELPLDEPGFPATGGNPETNPDYTVIPPSGMPLFRLASNVSETPSGGDPTCGVSFWNQDSVWGGPGASQNASAWHDVRYPTVYFPPGTKLTKTLSFTCSKVTPCSVVKGEAFNVVLNSSITFTSPGIPTPNLPISRETPPGPKEIFGPPTPFDWLPEDKRAARLDLVPALENAQHYCTPYALGLLGFGTGVLLAGAPTASGVLVVSGSLTALAAEPFCVATLTRVAKDMKRYRDPPDLNFHLVAHPAARRPPALPGCGRWRGATLSFCKRLRAAESRWVGAAQEVARIEEALATTTNRASAALAARDNAGIALQASTGRALEAREAGALAAKNAAGNDMAATLRRAGIRFRLSRAQSRLAIKAVERALTKLGVSTTTLMPLAGGALKPSAVDLLATLGR